LRQTQRLLRANTSAEVLARMKLESEVFAERLGSAEAKEAFTAFFEKRKPNFRA
jgi:enoyl-CoA hydratase/carnithine racemase